MKILYAIQGTGNGHLARATEIVPILQGLAETDILVSGIQGDIELPFEVKYRLYGLSFIFGKKGGVDVLKTISKLRLIRLIIDLIKLPVNNYDVVISDFEPISAWACRFRNKKCIGMSHQNAVLHPKTPKPLKKNLFGIFILKYYAPTHYKYGFHFKKLDTFNHTPVIRPDIRKSIPTNKGHYTVYLPAFKDSIVEDVLLLHPDISWEVFSKHIKKSYQKNNIRFDPVSIEKFNQSFIHCEGILCSAGFETPAEALFMGKKLCVIPIKNQYEQACNAAFLKDLGIPILQSLTDSTLQIKNWLTNKNITRMNYKNNIGDLLYKIISEIKT